MGTPITIRPDWKGEEVAILASGPSLTIQTVEALRGMCRVIAINNQFQIAPWADIFFAADWKWWDTYWHEVKILQGKPIAMALGMIPQGVFTVRKSSVPYDERPEFLSDGLNSGYAAICLGARMGAKRIYLHGYDMRNVDGKPRRFEYGANLNKKPNFKNWLPRFDELAPILAAKRIDVINCTPHSALRSFPFAELRKAG